MRVWWNKLQARERRMLGVGAVVVALLLGYAFAWYPLAHLRATLTTRVARQQEDLNWMLLHAAQAKDIKTRGANSSADRQGKSLLALADVSARGAGLAGALKRVEPTGGNSVRVSFEIADFDNLINWLDALGRDYGVQVTDFSADKVEGLGLVNARATLEDSAH
jgi:general secretion pathway protein M